MRKFQLSVLAIFCLFGNLSAQDTTCVANYDFPVVWGLEEGAFDGSLGDWTTVGISGEDHVFEYSPDGRNIGFFAQGALQIESPTVCNGAAIIDFDFLTTNGEESIAVNLEQPWPTYTAELISPTIDLSDVAIPTIEFYHFYSYLNGSISCSYSIDDGITWTKIDDLLFTYIISAIIDLLPYTAHNSYTLQELAFQENVKFKITVLDCDFHNFMIDDFIIRGDLMVSNVEENPSLSQLNISPNPTGDYLHIGLPDELNTFDVTLELFDTAGKLVLQSEILKPSSQSIKLDLHDFSDGAYFLKLKGGGHQWNERVILSR